MIFKFFFSSSLITDLSQESDTERFGIIREYEGPYKCAILSAAVVAAAVALGWEGGVRMMGRQHSQSHRVLQGSAWFNLISKELKLL